MLTTCIWKETGREGGPDLPPQSHLLTVRYLHRVSASVHRVLWAVGSGATPVEVQLDGVVNIWKAAASHRHAAPNLEDDWKPQNPTLIQKQQAFRGLWDPNLCVCVPECPSFWRIQCPVWISSKPSRCKESRDWFLLMRPSRLMGEWCSSSNGWQEGTRSPHAYGSKHEDGPRFLNDSNRF